MPIVKGYKVFNSDWTCLGFQYEVGGKYEMSDPIEVCGSGFHFCKRAVDCFNYYAFAPDNKVAEVIAYGDVKEEGDKCCTNKIEIVQEILWQEVLTLVNMGKDCTGYGNVGRRNSGSWNSGNSNSGSFNSNNYNSGNCNSGYFNAGDRNVGCYNSGSCNTGDYNYGHRNSGCCNLGNYNTGDWNKADHCNGCFNTIEPKIYLFNKLSNLTYEDWSRNRACRLLECIGCTSLKYVSFKYMSAEEKAAHPEAKVTGGYLKKIDRKDDVHVWWSKLDETDKDCIKSIPNFDAEIFKEITGIDVNE